MKRSALCVSMALLLLLAILPGRALAETGLKVKGAQQNLHEGR